MQMYAHESRLAALEAGLAAAGGAARLDALVPLAWHLRQRDTRRALALASEAESLLAEGRRRSPARTRSAARLLLVRAEAEWLNADLGAAEALLAEAEALFAAAGDRIGSGDVLWLAASVLMDRGEGERCDASLRRTLAEYVAGGDAARADATVARSCWYMCMRDHVAANAGMEERFGRRASADPGVAAWVEGTRGTVALLSGEFGAAARHFAGAYAACLATGQIRQAILVASNTADNFTTLNDLDTALEWGERGLELARSKAWPMLLGVALQQPGEVLRLLGRYDQARTLLLEAVDLLSPYPQSHNYSMALLYLGRLSLDAGEDEAALAAFARCEAIGRAHSNSEELVFFLCDQGSALSRLGRPAEAVAKIEAALAVAQESRSGQYQIAALRALADLHRRHRLPPPAGLTAGSAALHYLGRARAIADRMDGYLMPPDLLEELAAEHARAGDAARAYELSLEAGRARARIETKEAGKRAIAMQVRVETAQLRTEAEHHRQLGLAEAQRARVLQQANATLEQLGDIGREITGNLDAAAVFATLDHHINALLEATTLVLYRPAADGQALVMAFGVEDGRPLPPHAIPIDDQTSFIARCARDRSDIVADILPGAIPPLSGTQPTTSLMCAPLMVGERLLGALSIQSTRQHAYAERERAIFRSLCAYGAIALANAEALAALHQAQAELVEKNMELERLSVTDRLTGLYNRRFLDHVLEREFAAAKRSGNEFSLILLDLDRFKSINDGYGHQVGDEVLIAVAHILKERVRENDVVGRWGGEEFLVVCSSTPLKGAVEAAEVLRALIEKHAFPEVGRQTASFGVASFQPGDAVAAVAARADKALYAAKNGGRNRVVADAGPAL